ncbi:MAG: ATP-binding protein [Cyanobacteriota bacterium]|nr:ATP-binding protein [Cyanobacteriota bacterium]MDY6358416.1 ATP-binding protein [Cyanobacteriota bacterium]MDY6364905.1 ATP-binding protein [Cyanobacteriota bacterium]
MSLGKILYVDDDKLLTSTFATLMKVEGFNDVVIYNDPKEALEYLKIEQPDLIISDFLMPEMNGLEFLKEAKKLYPETSMILLTAYADKENAIKTINEIGVYKYIEKPWDNDDLIINIKNGIERSHLLADLRDKIEKLEAAQKELKKYSEKLEDLVTERTKELSVANDKLSGIINYCADGIIIIDSKGVIEQVNPATENMTGLCADALIGKSIQEIAYTDNPLMNKAPKSDIETSILGLAQDQSEFLLRDLYIRNSLSGEYIPAEINFAALSEGNKFVGVIRNFTAQKEAERLRDDFIATLTHDLRTPLLAAIQTLKFFLDGSLGEINDQQRVMLTTMVKSNEDLLGLVNALLEVYRFEGGKLKLCKTVFDVNSLLKQCHKELAPLAEKKNILFNTHCEPDGEILIDADRSEIKRVMMNLCGNAINYTNKDGTIDVYLKMHGKDLMFSVADNGNGIPKEDIPNLFKRFSQGTHKKRSTGTGLGLYLSRQIIEAHGGKIWVESKVNKGSEFSFILTDVAAASRVG